LKKVLFSLLLALVFITSCFSQQLEQDSVLVKKTLPNGLTYYIYPTDKVKGEGFFRLLVKVGSLQESEKQRGLAHFLEHMAFNGIAHFEANKLIDFLERNGSKFGHDLNAHTSYHETVYKLKIPTHKKSVLDSTMLIMSDWVDGMLLDSTEVEKERGVVLSEWLSKQSPQAESSMLFLNTLLNESRYTDRRVIGDTATLRNFKHKELKDFYDKWYDPSLMAIAVSGDVDVAEIEESIIERFGSKPSVSPKLKTYGIQDYKADSLIVYSDEWVKNTELNIIQLREPMRDVNNKQAYTHYLTRSLLNKLTEQRFATLSYDNPIYKSASISIGNYLPVKGAYLASIKLKPDQILEGMGQFNQHYKQLLDYGFTNAEIEKEKTSMLHSFETRVEKESVPSASGMIEQMQQDFFYGNSIVSLKSELELIRENFAEIDSLYLLQELNKVKNMGGFRYLFSTNEELIDSIPSKETLMASIKNLENIKVERYSRNLEVPENLLSYTPEEGKVLKIKELLEIDAKEIYLDNGAKIIYKQTDSAEEKVIFSGFRKGGYYALDSTDYVNAMYAAPVVSISGYGNFSREALSEYLIGNSAKVQLLIDKTRSGFSGSSDNEDVETLFELFYLKSTEPRADSTLFHQVKDRMVQSLEERTQTPKDKFYEDLKYLVRGEDYTTKPQTVEQIQENLKLEAMVPIYGKFFGVANNYVVTIITDKGLEELLPLIKTYIGGLPKGDISTDYKYDPRPVLDEETALVKRAGESPKSIVSLVYQQNKVSRNIPKLEIENELLESILKLKLINKLREDLGLVYSVSVAISSTQHPAPLSRQTISLVCDPKDVDRITKEIDLIIKGMVNGDIDFDDDLTKVKSNLIKVNKLKKQSNSYWTKAIRDYYFDDYSSWKFIQDYEEMVLGINEKQLRKKTKKYFVKTPEVKAIFHPKP
jgi:predicted Zn-dependent peptidase